MSCLRPWRYKLAGLIGRAGGAVAEGVNAFFAGYLEGAVHFQLVDAVGRHAQAGKEGRSTNTGRPDLEAGGDFLTVAQHQSVGFDLFDRRAGVQVYAQVSQDLCDWSANTLRQCRQQAWTGFDNVDVEVFRADPVEAVGAQQLGCVVQLGRQLDAGGAGADDRYVDWFAGGTALAGLGLHVLVQQLAVKALGLGSGIEEQAVFRSAGRIEVIGGAANGDHQIVVVQLARGDQFDTFFVSDGGQLNGAALAVQARHGAQLKGEVIPLALGHVIKLVFGGVQGAGSDLMQQGLPDMGHVGVDQGDSGLALAA